MVKILAAASQKGGVGKTTTVVNLADALASRQSRVLVVDMDPQGNATMGCGINKLELKKTVNEVLLGETDIEDSLVFTDMGFEVLGANRQLTVAEVSLLSMPKREQCLKARLSLLQKDYDFILIDCPPSLSLLTVNALIAAHGVIVPVQCEYYALEGLTELVRTIKELQPLNPQLIIAGILQTMYDSRNKLTLEVSTQLKNYFGEKVYRTVIPRNVRLAEAPSHGLPILHYAKASQGAQAYLSLADEILGVAVVSEPSHSKPKLQRVLKRMFFNKKQEEVS